MLVKREGLTVTTHPVRAPSRTSSMASHPVPGPRPPRHLARPSGDVRPAQASTRAVVLVLHGGRADSLEPSRRWHLSAVRMAPFARDLHRELGPQGIEVRTVRYRYRGWNGSQASPVQDARDALDAVRRDHPGVPVVLLGHSMGGRAALRVADDPSVRGVTALAPWLPDGEPVLVEDLVVHLAHGRTDRWTDPAATVRWAERARPVTADLSLTLLDGTGHFMLRRPGSWSRLARAGVLAGLVHALDDGRPPTGAAAAADPSGRRGAPN